MGDELIGSAALVAALIVLREQGLERWRWWRLGTLATVFGAAYTIFSEWRNVAVPKSWAYAEAMPTIPVGGFDLGLAPVGQWLLIPPLALAIAHPQGGSTMSCANGVGVGARFAFRRKAPR